MACGDGARDHHHDQSTGGRRWADHGNTIRLASPVLHSEPGLIQGAYRRSEALLHADDGPIRDARGTSGLGLMRVRSNSQPRGSKSSAGAQRAVIGHLWDRPYTPRIPTLVGQPSSSQVTFAGLTGERGPVGRLSGPSGRAVAFCILSPEEN